MGYFEKHHFLSRNCCDYFWAIFKKLGYVLLCHLVTLTDWLISESSWWQKLFTGPMSKNDFDTFSMKGPLPLSVTKCGHHFKWEAILLTSMATSSFFLLWFHLSIPFCSSNPLLLESNWRDCRVFTRPQLLRTFNCSNAKKWCHRFSSRTIYIS